MAQYLLTSTLQGASGLPEDRFVNQFAVDALGGADPAEQELLLDAMVGFWQAIPSGGLSQPAALIGPQLLRLPTNHLARLYDITGHLNGSPHGSPIAERGFAMTPPVAGNPLPTEVALCITMHGEGRDEAPVEVPDGADPGVAPDRPKQRHTGRNFFGPFTVNAVSNVGGIARPSAQIRDTFTAALHDLNRAINAINVTWDLAVWSRKDAVLRRMVATSVDDAFDTMRRRGEGPTGRITTVYVP